MIYHSYMTLILYNYHHSTIQPSLAVSSVAPLSLTVFDRLGLSKCSSNRIRDTVRQGSISCLRQSVPSETSRLVRCYSTDLPFLGKRVCCPRQRTTVIAWSLWEHSMCSLQPWRLTVCCCRGNGRQVTRHNMTQECCTPEET
jgi:hypothetical protein